MSNKSNAFLISSISSSVSPGLEYLIMLILLWVELGLHCDLNNDKMKWIVYNIGVINILNSKFILIMSY